MIEHHNTLPGLERTHSPAHIIEQEEEEGQAGAERTKSSVKSKVAKLLATSDTAFAAPTALDLH